MIRDEWSQRNEEELMKIKLEIEWRAFLNPSDKRFSIFDKILSLSSKRSSLNNSLENVQVLTKKNLDLFNKNLYFLINDFEFLV